MKAKKRLRVLLLLTMMFLFAGSINNYRETRAVDDDDYGYLHEGDYEYILMADGTAEILQYNGDGGNVIIPDTLGGVKVTKINGAFFECSNLTDVTIPEGVTIIDGNTFSNCSNLRNVIIPKSIMEIGWGAFYGCSSLTSITIPDNAQFIGDSAFGGCSKLSVINLPDKEIKMDGQCFRNTPWMEEKKKANPLVIVNGNLLDGSGCTGAVEIPKGTKYIAGGAFRGCNELTGVTIPDSVTEIGWGAFYECEELTEIIIPDSVTKIRENAFNSCSKLEEIVIPSTVKSIEERAFFDTPWLEKKRKENPLVIVNNILIDGRSCSGNVVIPEGVTEISAMAFISCENITDVTIPNSVLRIRDNAFAHCNSLTSVEIPDGVTELGWGVFRMCIQLKKVTVPASVTKMDIAVFGYEDSEFNEEDAYDGINPDLVIYTVKDSTAAQYAASYGIKTVYLDADSDANPTDAPSSSPNVLPNTAPTNVPNVSSNPKLSVSESPASNQTPNPDKTAKPSVKKVKAVKVIATKKKLTLKWKKSSGVSGYQVQISTKKEFKEAKKIFISKSKSTYTKKNLKEKKKYYIRIRAYKIYIDANKKTQKSYGKWVTKNKKTK